MPEEEPKAPAPEEGGNRDPNRNQWAQVARYVELGFVLPAATIAGWLLGAALDRWLHTGWIQGVGLILGSAGGIIELLRTLLTDESRSKRKSRT
jgi:F0F1-type ATP synthase assembly protein I